jgi:hypothetical protein
MALVKHLTALFFFVGVIGVSSGTVYEVGDSHGWNNDSSVDYKTWASTKNFHVGDIIRKLFCFSIESLVLINGCRIYVFGSCFFQYW